MKGKRKVRGGRKNDGIGSQLVLSLSRCTAWMCKKSYFKILIDFVMLLLYIVYKSSSSVYFCIHVSASSTLLGSYLFQMQQKVSSPSSLWIFNHKLLPSLLSINCSSPSMSLSRSKFRHNTSSPTLITRLPVFRTLFFGISSATTTTGFDYRISHSTNLMQEQRHHRIHDHPFLLSPLHFPILEAWRLNRFFLLFSFLFLISLKK